MSPSETGYPAVASTTIESAKYNAVIADIATALTLSIAANGETTITANIPLAGYKITGLGNASADTDALNRVTADARYLLLSGGTMTGQLVITNGNGVKISAAETNIYMQETDAAADEQYWRIVTSGGDFFLQTRDDSLGAGASALRINRTGTTVDSITFAGTQINLTCTSAAVNGDLAVDGAITCTDKGNFTMELATDSTGGSVLASGTAYWKRVGGVVTMRMPYLAATTTGTTLYLRGIPSACQPTLTGTYYQCPLVPGKINGADGAIQIDIYEGTAYWLLEGITAAFAGGSNTKGIGVTGSFGPVISYQVTD